MSGIQVENPPRILETYLFCCPNLDGKFRCLPKAGGYYEQNFIDMLAFKLIDQRVAQIRARQEAQHRQQRK